MNQLFWNAYKRLEKEVLALSEVIHFDDHQRSVYSSKIGDLLVRSVIEIESLSKVLFDAEGGIRPSDRDLYFDTDCLALLENKWKISRKTIFISSPYFYFDDENNKKLTPLHKAFKRGTSSSKWQQAYQAVKHDRLNNLRRGNVENLLNALGALYILNIYYRNATIDDVKDKDASNIDWGLGSEIFSVTISPESEGVSATRIYEPKTDYEESIYLVKHTDKTAQPFIDLMRRLDEEAMHTASKAIADALNKKVKDGELAIVHDLNEIKEVIKDLYDKEKILALKQEAHKNGTQIASMINDLRFEAVLNKQQY